MKILIITYYKGSIPFVDDLAGRLIKKGCTVEVFDMFDMMTLELGGEQKVSYHIKSAAVRKIFNLKLAGPILRLLYYKLYFLSTKQKYDHIGVHYLLPFYRFFYSEFKKMGKGLSVFIWGSDFYRVTDDVRRSLYPFYLACDSILIGNSTMSDQFLAFYGDQLKDQVRPVAFGMSKFELLKTVKETYTAAELKQKQDLPLDKLIVTVGYNGTRGQQHLLAIQALDKLPQTYKEQVFLLVPLGYGGETAYISEIEAQLEKTGIPYKLLISYLSDEDVVKMRIATDITITTQISDNSSSSIQEHWLAGNILLAGEWLPYKHFKNNGIQFWTFEEGNLSDEFLLALQNLQSYQDQVKGNSKAIYELSSWETRIDQWMEVYSNK